MFRKLFPMLALCAACSAVVGDDKAAPASAAASGAAQVQTAIQAQTPAAAQGQVQTAAPAQKAPANTKRNNANSGSWTSMMMPVLLIVVMIFFFSRANKKQQQKRQEMLDRITKGTKVLLNSGVYGKIVEVRENDFLVEIAENVRVLVVKSGVANVEGDQKETK